MERHHMHTPVMFDGHRQSPDVKLSYSSGVRLFEPRTQKNPGAHLPDVSFKPVPAQYSPFKHLKQSSESCPMV